jgi:hypothetical protein
VGHVVHPRDLVERRSKRTEEREATGMAPWATANARTARRAALLASLSIEARRLLPEARALVVERHAKGSEGWSVAVVLGPGGRRFGRPGTCRAVERAIASSFGLLVPYLPDVQRLTLDLEDPRRLGPLVSTRRRTPVGRRQTAKRYRVLSTSKRDGVEVRRYPDGSVVTVDTSADKLRRSKKARDSGIGK